MKSISEAKKELANLSVTAWIIVLVCFAIISFVNNLASNIFTAWLEMKGFL